MKFPECVERNHDKIIDNNIYDSVFSFSKYLVDIILSDQNNPSSEKDIISLKHLTKVAQNLIESGKHKKIPNIDLENIFYLNRFGAKKAEEMIEKLEEENKKNMKTLNGHFLSHAANMAEKLSKKEKRDKAEWKLRAFSNYRLALNREDRFSDGEHRKVLFTKATIMLYEIYSEGILEDSEVGGLVEDLIYSSKIVKNAYISSKCLERVVFILEDRFKETEDTSFLRECFEYNKKSANMIREEDPVKASERYGFTAEHAKELCKLSNGDKVGWAKIWLENKLRSAFIAKNSNSNSSKTVFAYKTYSFAADAAKELFKITKDPKWFDVLYGIKSHALELAKENNDFEFLAGEYRYISNLCDKYLRLCDEGKMDGIESHITKMRDRRENAYKSYLKNQALFLEGENN